jgi:hypothetical protein
MANSLLRVLQPLLMLLLLAGVPGIDGARAGDGRLVQAVDLGAKALWHHRDRATEAETALAEPRPDRLDDGAPEPAALGSRPAWAALDRARLVRVGRAAYPTAPPSHRPCAAPPTGPPSLA